MLKPGVDNVNAIINDSIMFVATKGQLILYWNYPQTALIADGRFGYIPPELLVRVDTQCFKFNFSNCAMLLTVRQLKNYLISFGL